MKVLAVEDDPEFREFLDFHLSKQDGLEIRVAGSGEEALQFLADEPPDVLVVDVNMPGMGGEELARMAREGQPGIRVVSFSGSDQSTSWADESVVKGGREELAQLVAAIRTQAEAGATDR